MRLPRALAVRAQYADAQARPRPRAASEQVWILAIHASLSRYNATRRRAIFVATARAHGVI